MENIKQVIVMRKDLGMNRGKIAAQAAHACMKIFFDRVIITNNKENGSADVTINFSPEMEAWRRGAFTKACLRVDSEEELLEIYNKAKKENLPVALITDSGQTTFYNIPTNTCIAIGPAKSEEIDKITGHLRLLG